MDKLKKIERVIKQWSSDQIEPTDVSSEFIVLERIVMILAEQTAKEERRC